MDEGHHMRLDFTVRLSHEDRETQREIAEQLTRLADSAAHIDEHLERIADHFDPLPKSYISWSVSEQPDKKE